MSSVHPTHPNPASGPDPDLEANPARLSVRTYAKINLILRVDQPDQARMHPICSWMHSINLWDELSVEQASISESEFDIRWDDGRAVEWDIESDLVFRVHQLMEQRIGRSMPIRVSLRKSIPSGGGLGGGSSNAAGMAMVLNRLFSCSLSERELQALVHEIGSDIPFFVDLESFDASHAARPAVVQGIGDQITRSHRLNHELTLLIPDFGCPTGAVYSAFDQISAEHHLRDVDSSDVYRSSRKASIDPGSLINDLTDPAMRAVPELHALMSAIRSVGIDPKLSGSGSTIYVLGDLGIREEEILRSIAPTLRVLRTTLA